MLQNLTRALDGNPALARRNRFAPLVIAVTSGAQEWTVRLGGERVAVEAGAPAKADLTFEASAQTWAKFAQSVPPVGYQALNGMMRVGHLKIGGDMLAFGRHMTLIEEVFASVRPAAAAAEAPTTPDEAVARRVDKLRYRYPRGESYEDVIERLDPVILEIERNRDPVVVVAHQAVVRCLYGYFAEQPPEACPPLPAPCAARSPVAR